ncbi:hypothetical protein [Pseudomonas rossensis]|uniref:hypothetical protein n=1 Tax=Pseudomonas rossensis TaxID=2305471 RepID=UPI0032608EE2
MDADYLYRLDYKTALIAIPDACHRARRWHGGPKSFPHKLLKAKLTKLSPAQAIYRICFFSTLAKAQQTRQEYRDNGADTTLGRCRKSEVLTAGFAESWDDGFAPGDAYLFWIEEDLSDENHEFSQAAIPFDRFDAFIDGDWVPMTAHIALPSPVALQHLEPTRDGGLGLLARLKAAFQSS